MEQSFLVTSFYKFTPISENELEALQDELRELGRSSELRGLVLIGVEGINATVSGLPHRVQEYKAKLQAVPLIGELLFKDSLCHKHPFNRYKVKIRPEIVTIGDTGILPQGSHRHLTPEEWHKVMAEEDVVVLDTRNIYEWEMGTFDKAVVPPIETFGEFPEYVRKSDIPKDKKVLIFCTGGIRCEKAIYAMEKEGYNNVYQLEGGILKYLEKFPDGHFKGDCFVFDHRIAVNQRLEPVQGTKYCPHCGQPAKEHIKCERCDQEVLICSKCMETPHRNTCSKNCAYHFKMRPGRKGPGQLSKQKPKVY